MRAVLLSLVCLGLVGFYAHSVAAPAPLANITITGNGKRGTKNCNGGVADIMGNKHVLTLKNCKKVTVQGNANKLALKKCRRLDVLGNKNRVKAGKVKAIKALGNHNTVLYKLGPKKKKPAITNLGNHNTIKAVK